ncbi:MAG: GerAB/ArcD/ProY family transporter [Firmicutes bacterium]|nr:GerAB/ArcD/ProY family transporter [Bacillota bacterium]
MADRTKVLGEALSPSQLGTLLVAGYATQALCYFPRPQVTYAGRAALLTEVAAGLAAALGLWLWIRVAALHPGESPEAALRALGPAQWPLVIGIAAYHILLGMNWLMIYTSVLHGIFLEATPLWALAGAILAESLYLAWNQVVPLARALQSLWVPVAVFTVFSLAGGMALIRHPRLLWPALPPTARGFALGSLHGLSAYLGLDAVAWFYPYVHPAARRTAGRHLFWWLAGSFAAFSWALEDVMGTFGPDFIPALRWPMAQFVRLQSLATFYVNKFGLVVLLLWTVTSVSFEAVHITVAAQALHPLGGYRTRAGFRWHAAVVALLIGGVLVGVRSPYRVQHLLGTTTLLTGAVYTFSLPLLLLGANALAGRRTAAGPRAGEGS